MRRHMPLFGKSANRKLRDAAAEGDAVKVRGLIAKGADVHAVDSDGWTALHYATNCDEIAAFEVLLAAGADANARDENGDTPLHFASEGGYCKALGALIAAGADPNAKNGNGETPLHITSSEVKPAREVKIVKALIVAGADANARDDDEETPLHFASKTGRVGVVEALVAAGADVRAENNDGETPHDLAETNGHSAVVELLNGAQALNGAQSEPESSNGAAFYQKIVDLGQGEWGKEGINEELKDIGASIADLHMLKIFYTLVASLRRTATISDKVAARHVLNSLTTSVELCTCSSSIATYKIVLDKASDDRHLSTFDRHRLDNEAEVARMGHAPFVRDIVEAVRQHTARIEGLEANVESINNAVDKIRKGIQHKMKVEGVVGMISATLNVLSFGVGGTAVSGTVQMFLNQIVDFGDVVHLEEIAAKLADVDVADQVKGGIGVAGGTYADSKIKEAVKEGNILLVVSATAAMMYTPTSSGVVPAETVSVLGEDDPDTGAGTSGETKEDGEDEVKDWLLRHIRNLREEDAANYRDRLAETGFDCIESMEDLEEEDLEFMKVAHRRKLSKKLAEDKND